MIPDLRIEDYDYSLSDDRIAKYPLPERDSSKLLLYSDGKCSESTFRNLPSFLPSDSLMVFNDTKVVPARLFFRRTTGALIELFCLKPIAPAEYSLVFSSKACCLWKCVIGNARKWKGDILAFEDGGNEELRTTINLRARLVSRDEGPTGNVEFSWDGGIPFSRVLELCGQVPIPPYLNRETEAIDVERYQTLYAHTDGSVAAPTAGLHFTDRVLKELSDKGIDCRTVCLHVGAGTFLPVKSSKVSEHTMHKEPFVVTRDFIEDLRRPHGQLVAVGTTSVRTLESLYYVGVHCIEEGEPADVDQWAPYERDYPYTTDEALDAITAWMDRNGRDSVSVETRIIIVPGFRFRIVDKIVTNFHQPQSTLLLLVSAFVGGDWKTIYDYALGHGFRFLSYGDSSLLSRRNA